MLAVTSTCRVRMEKVRLLMERPDRDAGHLAIGLDLHNYERCNFVLFFYMNQILFLTAENAELF